MQKKRLAITISPYMDKTYKIRKIGGDKIALLGLFVVSLLMARMIVVSRSAILLSEPIKLPRSGLSVSMPEGNGWKSEKQWNYYENVFSLRSIFALGNKKFTAEARCVYIPATKAIDPQNLFVQKALDVEGEIVKVDRITNDTLTFDWAYIENPKASLIFILGTAKLSYNHRLDIEVWQIMNDPGMAERAFKKIVQNLNFEENQLIQTDSQTITQLKSSGINGFSDKQKQIYKKFEPPEDTFIIESTTADYIITKFPKQADYIQRTNKMPQ
ncbi:MAG: hypothetical protein ACYSR9_05105 [Planctomycetota bacterium]